MRKSFLTLTMTGLLLASPAWAEPQGGSVVSGSATIVNGAGGTTIRQDTDRAILNWNRFNINPGEFVRFLQPSATSAVLNRVTGLNPSYLMGELSATGRVFLVNPSGIVFGPTATVNVGSLFATTLQINDQDFMRGNYVFVPEGAPSFVVNQGAIQAADGGYVVLMAPLVVNEGTIVARLGTVTLASVPQTTVSFDGQGLVHYVLPEQPDADVIVPGNLLDDVIGGLVTTSSTDASGVELVDGQVRLVGGGGMALNTGSLQAGQINLAGDRVGVLGQGSVTGSQVNLQGDRFAFTSTESLIRADQAYLKAGDSASINGAIEIGAGGFVETSAANLSVSQSPSLGTGSTWLIDPNNLTISTLDQPQGTTQASPFVTLQDNAYIMPSVIESALSFGSTVIVQTGTASPNSEVGDIIIESPINPAPQSPGQTPTLILQAHHDIRVQADIGGSTALNVQLEANYLDTTTDGSVRFESGDVQTLGGTFTASGVNLLQTAGRTVDTAGGAVQLDFTGDVSLNGLLDAGAGPVTLNSGGNIQAGNLVADSVTIDGAGLVQLTTQIDTLTVTTPGAVDVQNTGGLTVNGVSGSTVALTSTGSLLGGLPSGTDLTAGSADLSAAGDIDLNTAVGSLEASGIDIQIDQQAGDLLLSDIIASTLTVTAPANLSVDTVTTSGAVDLAATGNILGLPLGLLSGTSLQVSGNQIALATQVGSLDGSSVGTFSVTNTGDLSLGTLSAGGPVTLDVTGDLTGALSAPSANLTATGLIDVATTLGSVSAQGLDVTLTQSAGDLDATSVTGGNIVLRGANNLSLGTIAATGNVDLSAPGDITMDPGGSVAGDSLNFTGSGDVTLVTQVNQLSGFTSGDISVTNTGDLALYAVQSGGALAIGTTGNMLGVTGEGSDVMALTATLTATGDIDLRAEAASLTVTGNDVQIGQWTGDLNLVLTTVDTLQLDSPGNISLGLVTATSDVSLTAVGNVTTNTGGLLTADGLDVSAGGPVQLVTQVNHAGVATPGTVNLGNTGNLVLDGISGSSVTLGTTGNLTGQGLPGADVTAPAASLTAGGTLGVRTDVDTLDLVGGNVSITEISGNLNLQSASTTTLDVTVPNDLTVGTLTSLGSTSLTASGTITGGILTAAALTLSSGLGVQLDTRLGGLSANLIAGDLDITNTGDLVLGTVVVPGDVRLDVTGDITTNNLVTADGLAVTGTGDIQLITQVNHADVATPGTVKITDAGDLLLDGLAGSAVSVFVSGDLTATSPITAGSADLTATGNINLTTTVDTLTVSGAAVQIGQTAGDLDLIGGTVTTLNLNAPANLSVGAVTASSDVSLSALGNISMDLGGLLTADGLTVTASGPVQLVTAVNHAGVTTPASVNLSNTGDLFLDGISGASADVSASGAITGQTGPGADVTAVSASLLAGGNLTVRTAVGTLIVAGLDAQINQTTGNLDLAGATVDNLILNVPGSLSVGTTQVSNSAVLSAGGPVTSDRGGLLTAASLTVDSAGGVNLVTGVGNLTVASAAGDVVIDNTGDLNVASIQTPGVFTLTERGDVRSTGLVSADGLSVVGTGSVSLQTQVNHAGIATPGPVNLNNDGDLSVDGVAGSVVALSVLGDLTGAGTIAAGRASLAATVNIDATTSVGVLDLAGTTVRITQTLGDLELASATATSLTVSGPANLTLGGVTSSNASLQAGGAVSTRAGGLLVAGSLVVNAGQGVSLATRVGRANLTAAGDIGLNNGGDLVLEAVTTPGNVNLTEVGNLTTAGLIQADSLGVDGTGTVQLVSDVNRLRIATPGAVNVSNAGDLILAGVNSGTRVELTTTGDLTGAGLGEADLVTPQADLTSGGGIALRTQTGSVSAVALDDIQIDQATGNLVLLFVIGDNVRVTAGDELSVVGVLGTSSVELTAGGSILGAPTALGVNLSAGDGARLTGQLVGTEGAPLQVDVDGDVSVLATEQQDGISGVLEGSVRPTETLDVAPGTPGKVLFNGETVYDGSPVVPDPPVVPDEPVVPDVPMPEPDPTLPAQIDEAVGAGTQQIGNIVPPGSPDPPPGGAPGGEPPSQPQNSVQVGFNSTMTNFEPPQKGDADRFLMAALLQAKVNSPLGYMSQLENVTAPMTRSEFAAYLGSVLGQTVSLSGDGPVSLEMVVSTLLTLYHIDAGSDPVAKAGELGLLPEGLGNGPVNRGDVYKILDAAFFNLKLPDGRTLYQAKFDDTPPTVSVATFPAICDAKVVTLKGTVSPDTTLLQVGYQDSDVVTPDDNGAWTANVPLEPGMNTITVQAHDAAGNITTRTIQIWCTAGKS